MNSSDSAFCASKMEMLYWATKAFLRRVSSIPMMFILSAILMMLLKDLISKRPLTVENLHDPESGPLTPNQILTMKSRVVLPPPGEFQAADVYCRKRWRIAQHLANSSWSSWRKAIAEVRTKVDRREEEPTGG